MKRNILYSCVLILALIAPQTQAAFLTGMLTRLTKNILTPIERETEKVLAIIGTGIIAGLTGAIGIKLGLKKIFAVDKQPLSFKQFAEELKKLGPETKNITLNFIDKKDSKLDDIITLSGTCGGVICGIAGMWAMYKVLYPDKIVTKEDLAATELKLKQKINLTATIINKNINDTKIELKKEITDTAIKVDNVNLNVTTVDTKVNKLGNQIGVVEQNLGKKIVDSNINLTKEFKKDMGDLGKQVEQNLGKKIVDSNINLTKEFKKDIENLSKKVEKENLYQNNFRNQTDKNFSDMNQKLEKVNKSTNTIDILKTSVDSLKKHVINVEHLLTTNKPPTSPEYQQNNHQKITNISNYISEQNIRLTNNHLYYSILEQPDTPIYLLNKQKIGDQQQKSTPYSYLTQIQKLALTNN